MNPLVSAVTWLVALSSLAVASTARAAAPRTTVSLADGRWQINGQITCRGAPAEGLLLNVRAVNPTFEDRKRPEFDAEKNADEFIEQIPNYVAHGVRAFTLNLQGGMPGYEGAVNTAFEADGSLRRSYLRRIERVIEACDRHGAVVILQALNQHFPFTFQGATDDPAVYAALKRLSSAESISAQRAQVLAGLRAFLTRTARADGSFANGLDPDYRGMSDSAYSDLAAVTYAVVLHKTFGWKLPHEEATRRFLLSRQQSNGDFFNVAGTVDPKSAEGRVYNTTQGIVALRALGARPRYEPLRVFEEILQQDYKTLPAYSTSFFPLAYLASGQPIPPEADRRIRATMVPAPDGYLNNHIAATFHAAHYHRLIGEPTPMADRIIARALREQKSDGSWLLNMPSRDRHATFDAVFTLRQLGSERVDCRAAIERAARWALSCRNADGGFGHFPGSTSDADANYFQAGTLVMAGFLPPAEPSPVDGHLLSWGHVMPLPAHAAGTKK